MDLILACFLENRQFFSRKLVFFMCMFFGEFEVAALHPVLQYMWLLSI